MGGSLLKGWISSKYKNISVIDPNKKVFKKINKVKYYNSISKIKDVSKFDVIFFAVKPQILNKVIKPYKKIIFKNILIVSIVAGKKVNYFEKEFGKNTSVVRTMPNLPALVGKGVTCLFANSNTNKIQKKIAAKLFESAGKVFWVNKESYIDKFTAMSGSGPAYFYYFIECVRDAGIKIGLDKKLSYELAKETAIGSIALLERSKEEAKVIRKRIMIKGGTTEAGINKLIINNKINKIVSEAVKSAFKRAQYLGKKAK